MNRYPLSCDIDAIRAMEANYKQQLGQDPANMEVRLELAWCLFMQSLHEAGRESLIDTISAAVKDVDRKSVFREVRTVDRKAYDLLKACLLETYTVLQLSPQSPDDVEKLHALVRLSGAAQAIQDARDDASKVMSKLTRDIAQSSDW